MNGLTIENSCFSNEAPHALVFPDDLTGVTFVDCNLDNVFVPEGNTIVGGSHRYFQVKNDGEDWVVDPDTLEPIEPLNLRAYEMLQLSVDPRDLPAEPMEKSIIIHTRQLIADAQNKAVEDYRAGIESGDIVVPVPIS